MSNHQSIQKFDYLSVLLRAPDAIKNRKAFLLCAGTLLVTAIGYGIGTFLAIKLFSGSIAAIFIASGIITILAVLIFWTGFSGVGLLLMDQAHDIEPRSMMDAVIGGLMCMGKFLLVLLLDALFGVLFLGACALLLVVCKIPGIGPTL